MMKKQGFTSVELMMVVVGLLVCIYCVGPAVHGVGRAIGKWFATPTPEEEKENTRRAVESTSIVIDDIVNVITGKGGPSPPEESRYVSIKPGQKVVLTMALSGQRLNNIPVTVETLGAALADLAARGVFVNTPLTVIIENGVRVLDSKALKEQLDILKKELRFRWEEQKT